MTNNKKGIFARMMKTASKIESHELKATFASFAMSFTLMTAYYILRPVRDAMASDWSDAEVSILWTINFFISTAAVALYGYAISRISLRRLIPAVYIFFAASFVLFYAGTQTLSDIVLIDKSFYVWVSVFAMFHISVFWSLMADTFSKEQSSRLFAFIATGSITGAIVGAFISTVFSTVIGTYNLMLVATVLLVFIIPLITYIDNLKHTELRNEDVHADLSMEKIIGGNPFAGFIDFIKSPYLLGIGLFILLYTALGSFVYFELKNLMTDLDRDVRTSVWAAMDLAINTLGIFTALFATSRLATRFGLASTLALVPIIIVIGMLLLAVAPLLWAAVTLQVVRRAGNFAITRPAREMLFTTVGRETRFKTKPVIDIVSYRGGDMIWAWAWTGLTEGIGIGLGAMAAVGAGIAGIWAVVGAYLGRFYDLNNKPLATDTDQIKAATINN